MRIAMPYDNKNGKISLHMGQAKFFKFYNVENNQVVTSFTIASGVEGHEATAAFLKAAGAQLVICAGLGGPMIKALYNNGIMVMGGIAGEADVRMDEFLKGTIAYRPIDPKNPHSGCQHHHGGDGHNHDCNDCGHHGEEGCSHPDGMCDSEGCCH